MYNTYIDFIPKNLDLFLSILSFETCWTLVPVETHLFFLSKKNRDSRIAIGL